MSSFEAISNRLFWNHNLLIITDLQTVFGIFWSYFIYKQEEGKLHIDWEISNKLKGNILAQINVHIDNKADLGAINDTIIRIKNRFGYDLLQIE